MKNEKNVAYKHPKLHQLKQYAYQNDMDCKIEMSWEKVTLYWILSLVFRMSSKWKLILQKWFHLQLEKHFISFMTY